MEQKAKKLMIFLAGELRDKGGVEEKMRGGSFDYYAADGGYLLADKLGVPLQRILGDFDTVDPPKAGNVYRYPAEKDQTDSALALDHAIEDNYRDIWMIAPFGGRLDHTIANLALLEAAAEKGAELKLYDGENLAFLLGEGMHVFSGARYRYISFFSWGGKALVSLRDFKYPLDHDLLERRIPLGISNEPAGEEPVIEVHSGRVLCICIENKREVL